MKAARENLQYFQDAAMILKAAEVLPQYQDELHGVAEDFGKKGKRSVSLPIISQEALDELKARLKTNSLKVSPKDYEGQRAH